MVELRAENEKIHAQLVTLHSAVHRHVYVTKTAPIRKAANEIISAMGSRGERRKHDLVLLAAKGFAEGSTTFAFDRVAEVASFLPTYLPTHLLTCLPTFLPAYLLTYILAYLARRHLPSGGGGFLRTYLPTYLLTCLLVLACLLTCFLTYLLTYLLAYLPTCLLQPRQVTASASAAVANVEKVAEAEEQASSDHDPRAAGELATLMARVEHLREHAEAAGAHMHGYRDAWV